MVVQTVTVATLISIRLLILSTYITPPMVAASYNTECPHKTFTTLTRNKYPIETRIVYMENASYNFNGTFYGRA